MNWIMAMGYLLSTLSLKRLSWGPCSFVCTIRARWPKIGTIIKLCTSFTLVVKLSMLGKKPVSLAILLQ